MIKIQRIIMIIFVRIKKFFKLTNFMMLVLLVLMYIPLMYFIHSQYELLDFSVYMTAYSVKKGTLITYSRFKLKDWHDYDQIESDKQKTGIGEQGKAADVEDLEFSSSEIKLFQKNGYNAALSDKIALTRSLPDIRHELCKKRLYIESLPTVSVVIPFHNEHLSTLLRTVCTVLMRSPEHLIEEIFLVDNASTKDSLKKELNNFVKKHFTKVKVVRFSKRKGLAAASRVGAKMARAEVLVFLDSCSEVNVNWLPPLLEPIVLDNQVAVVPLIDEIVYNTFEYLPFDSGSRGFFDWDFTYSRYVKLPKDEVFQPEPFETPVMRGGVFAISRQFFWELGGYDPGLDKWGGGQLELSFKIWQCGGRIKEAVCSRVGLVFPEFIPDYNPSRHNRSRNIRRIAEVWMDEYAKYVYQRIPETKTVDPGDLTQQKALRQKLRCKPFKWFMTQVAFDLTYYYPLTERLPYAEGRIRPKLEPLLCITGELNMWQDVVKLKSCSPKHVRIPPGSDFQKFILTWHTDIQRESSKLCWDVGRWDLGSKVRMFPCQRVGNTQQWRYYEETKQLESTISGYCLDYDPNNDSNLFLNICNKKSKTQKWIIDTVYKERLAKWREPFNERPTGPIEERNKSDYRNMQ